MQKSQEPPRGSHDAASTITATLSEGRRLLIDSGHRPTAHRLAILALLAAAEHPMTVAELSASQRHAGYVFSTATLYRTVALWVELGVVIKSVMHDGETRYAARTPVDGSQHRSDFAEAPGAVED